MTTIIISTCIFGVAMASLTLCPNKTELDTCLERLAPMMPKSGLPIDRNQLISMCRAFKAGMKCVDGYTSRCMTQVERAGLEEHLKGARSTLAFLCDDPIFQRDYLSHGTCIKQVQEDWDKCHNHFKYLVNQEHIRHDVTDKERDNNICCIRTGLLRCVYNVSYLKCGKTQAIFLKKVTATLSYSDVQQDKCRNVTHKTCSSAPHSLCSGSPGVLLLLSLLLLSVYFHLDEHLQDM